MLEAETPAPPAPAASGDRRLQLLLAAAMFVLVVDTSFMNVSSLTAVIVFWALVGGVGASLLLPAMQSLVHGNFAGEAQKKAYAMVGAAAAVAAAVGPLLGGFITTYLSWRVAFAAEGMALG
jgi:MFS family permease